MVKVGFILHQDFATRSVRRVGDQFLEALSRHFEVVQFSSETGKLVPPQVDIVISLLPVHLERSSAPGVPFLYPALGTLPVGGLRFLRLLSDLRNIDSILYSCTSDEVILKRIFPRQEIGTRFLPFGVDLGVFHPRSAEETSGIRKAFGISDSAKLLVYAGRLARQKNIHLLFDILAGLRQEIPDLVLLLAGSTDTVDSDGGAYRGKLDQLVSRNNLDGSVIFAGDQEDDPLARMYSSADVFVTCTTNRDENFGYAAVEAMACGAPVVCSKWGGLKDTVVEGQTGYFMKTRLTDTQVSVDVAAGIRHLRLLLKDKDARRRMGEAAVAHVRANYGLDVFSRRLAETIHETLARRDETRTVIPGSRFELHPLAFELLARTEYSVKEDFYDRVQQFSPEDRAIRNFFLSPYSSTPANPSGG